MREPVEGFCYNIDMNILVTGGAGYIGSFMTKKLLEEGISVVVVDNLERGHKEVIDPNARFVNGDLRDKVFVEELFANNSFDGVVHFAAYISMAESMQDPSMYFDNNVNPVRIILDQMQQHDVKSIIFSSTAGVYGNPTSVPIPESHQKKPTNPYGESKLLVEQMLKWYQKIYGINYVALRYFNAAGASLDGLLGENHDPETHIIPNIIKAVLERKNFTLFGNDYDTPDGTCVRDYIHVLDLVQAHVLALKKIQKDHGGYFYNVGTGKGYSNKEVVEKVREVSGRTIEVVIKDRRPGDASALVADASKINHELGFKPRYSDLETIVRTAWAFHQKMHV
jgi:UDP-glucose 4-epimerase